MKFHKVLKKMMKNPRRKFHSKQAGMFAQTLYSIRFWLTGCDGDTDLKYRKKTFLKIIKATDWQEELIKGQHWD